MIFIFDSKLIELPHLALRLVLSLLYALSFIFTRLRAWYLFIRISLLIYPSNALLRAISIQSITDTRQEYI